MTRVLSSALHISAGEAAGGRVRAAETLAERMSMTGEPLEPLRPHLAAKQRSGEASAENADVVIRVSLRCMPAWVRPRPDRRRESAVAQFATQFGQRTTHRLASRWSTGSTRTAPCPRKRYSRTGGSLGCGPPRTGFAGEFRLTADCGANCCRCCIRWRSPESTAPPRPRGERSRSRIRVTTGSGCTTRSNDVCDRLLRSEQRRPRLRRHPHHRDRHHRPRRPPQQHRPRRSPPTAP